MLLLFAFGAAFCFGSALVLAQFGSGPIRGFAITLLIGIATSIFTGVFATRVFFDWQSNRKGFDKVSI